MFRLFYGLGAVAVLAASGVLGLSVRLWCKTDLADEPFLSVPSAMERFTESARERAQEGVGTTSPLVAQAELLASLLAPVRLTQAIERDMMPALVSPPRRSELVPPVWPPAASVNFKLRATSYYPNEPGRSMALVSDGGSAEGDQRWVKEGAKLGHFVIHEIRRGVIVYRDGEQLREMAVERGTALPRLVRDPRPGSPTARAAPPADPATIEIRGD